MIRPPPGLRRAAALALLVGVFAGAGLLASALEQARRASLDGIEAQRALLGRLEAIGALSAQVAEEFRAGRDNPAHAWFMAGESEALIVAQLQQRLQDIAAVHGAQVLRAGEADAKEIDGQPYRGLRIELVASIESLQKTLLEIEAGNPFLFITRARLGADMASRVEPQSPPLFRVELDVYGALLPPQFSKAGALSP